MSPLPSELCLSILYIIGGCRAQNEPGHGGLSMHETFILWLNSTILATFLSQAARSTRAGPWHALACSHL